MTRGVTWRDAWGKGWVCNFPLCLQHLPPPLTTHPPAFPPPTHPPSPPPLQPPVVSPTLPHPLHHSPTCLPTTVVGPSNPTQCFCHCGPPLSGKSGTA